MNNIEDPFEKIFDRMFDQKINVDKLRSKKILITGATGLIGSFFVWYISYLNKKYKINVKMFLICRDKVSAEKALSKYPVNNITFIEGDLTKKIIFPKENQYDYIIHAASPSDPKGFSMFPVETTLCNIYGITALLDVLKKQKKGRLLFVSSGEVYGKSSELVSRTEEESCQLDILNYRSCYPLSKQISENLCVSYKKEFGVDFVIVRPCHVFGPTINDRNFRADAQFLRMAAAKQPILLESSGVEVRSYCFVADVCSGMLTALFLGESGEAYNIADSNSILSVKNFADLVASESSSQVICLSKSTDNDRFYRVLSSEKLRKLGWNPKFKTKESIMITFNLYKRIKNVN